MTKVEQGALIICFALIRFDNGRFCTDAVRDRGDQGILFPIEQGGGVLTAPFKKLGVIDAALFNHFGVTRQGQVGGSFQQDSSQPEH